MWQGIQKLTLLAISTLTLITSQSEDVDKILDRCLLLIDDYSKEKSSPEPNIEVGYNAATCMFTI